MGWVRALGDGRGNAYSQGTWRFVVWPLVHALTSQATGKTIQIIRLEKQALGWLPAAVSWLSFPWGSEGRGQERKQAGEQGGGEVQGRSVGEVVTLWGAWRFLTFHQVICIGRTDADGWSSNSLATWCKEPAHWKRPWCWERLRAGEGDDRGWDGCMASSTQWTWVWANSARWWRTEEPGVLQSTGSQRVRHDWATEHHHQIN